MRLTMVINFFQTNLNLVWNLRLAKFHFFFPNQTGIGLENPTHFLGVSFPNQTGFGLEKDTEWNLAPLHMHRPSNNHSPNIRPPSGNALQFTAIRSNFLHKSTLCVRIVQVQLPPSPAIPNQLPIVNYPLPDCSIPSIIVRSLPLQSIPNISFHSNRSAFPRKNSWQLFPFGSAAGQKEMLFVRLNRTGGPSFTVKCAIVRDYIVGRHKSFCVNSLHHNTPPT